MSITPRGMSIQEAYRLFRDGNLLINRKYQRKLVWTEEEKVRLIDSIMESYPIPLILLAERPQLHGHGKYEILDGLQRLNAIFGFIENSYSISGKFFDVSQLARAKQLSENGMFQINTDESKKLSPKECANFLDYQLAITIYPAMDEDQIIEVFGRINSGGKQLSNQERRQAGIINNFSELVRRISADLRGDISREVLLLSEMPEISIDTSRARQNYGLRAEEIFWCKQGVLTSSQLRDSEDEEMIVDILASILLEKPLARSKEMFDELYDSNSETYRSIQESFATYPIEKSYEDVKLTFSVLREIIETYSNETNCLRNVVSPNNRNPIKNSFYTIFMSFFELLVRQGRSPENYKKIMESLIGLQTEITGSAHYSRSEDRIRNVDKTTGLIQKYFIKKEPSALRHGPGLALDFENSIRRSRIETPRYEFKQGLLRLSDNREIDNDLLERIINTICGIANLGPNESGYLYIGVVDKQKDAERIKTLDKVTPLEISERFVVGINREVKILNYTIDQYLQKIVTKIRTSGLSEPLKTQVISQIDVVDYRGLTIIRLLIPMQNDVSFVNDTAFIREGNETIKVDDQRKLISISKLFSE
jgi:hypothetical protein